MKRRAFLGLTSAPWFVPLSGCIFNRASDQGLGQSAGITIRNYTVRDQEVALTVTDDSDEVIHSEQYTLSRDGVENRLVRESEVVRAGRTYYVDITTKP